jgi:hypothetical protein
VRVLQLGRDLDLPPEALAIDSGSELRRKHFDNDIPIERAFRCKEHSAHSPSGQLALKLVRRAKRVLEVEANRVWGRHVNVLLSGH